MLLLENETVERPVLSKTLGKATAEALGRAGLEKARTRRVDGRVTP
jgi:hypothetical protein